MLSKKIIWKLNIIDILLLAIIILSVAALIYKSAWGRGNNKYETYTITYVCESSPIDLLNKVEYGDICIDGSYGNEIGVLDNINLTPITENYSVAAISNGSAENNENDDEDQPSPTTFPTPEPVRAKAEFVTTVECMKTDHGIKIDKNIYLMGQSAQIIIGDVIFDVYISDIR